jgi:hypothetical protein
MAIEKALNQLPEGIQLEAEGPPIEIEIEIEADDDGLEVEIEAKEVTFEENLASEIDQGELLKVSDEVLDLIKVDLDSRKEWEKTYAEGIRALGPEDGRKDRALGWSLWSLSPPIV